MAMLSNRTLERIDELFSICSGSSGVGTADFKSISRHFWMYLQNSFTLVDVAGIFAVSSNNSDLLTIELFQDFFKAVARVKFPNEVDYCEKLLNDIRNNRNEIESYTFPIMMDKHIIRILLKYDLPIKRAYSNFCGQSVRVGGKLSWEEVKSMSIGMEIDGFVSFAGVYSVIPQYLSTEQCEIMFREVMNRYPLLGNAASLNTTLLFPQFQLGLILTAMERLETKQEAPKDEKPMFAKKVNESKHKLLADCLNDLLKDIGMNKYNGMDPTMNQANDSMSENTQNLDRDLFAGSVSLPNVERAEDMYSSANSSHSRQAMMLRMEHLFDEVESKVLQFYLTPESPILSLLIIPDNELSDTKVRLPSKPVVIGDAIPVPVFCPDAVEQLLEASLAHHNLGSFEDSLKFLEASRVQMADTGFRTKTAEMKGSKKEQKESDTRAAQEEASMFDLDMYIVVCKGNVYQSCGDDEQALLMYMEGWAKALNKQEGKSEPSVNGISGKEWEMVCVNSIGMLAYYNIRYEVAGLCFNSVANFREKEYGEESADTATAWNNESSCLFCIHKRSEARAGFEKAWSTISRVLGHRAPRAVTAWKNLEKSRRSSSHAAQANNTVTRAASVNNRPDADRLILGGAFTIQALDKTQKASKGKKGGKKKKK